MNFEHPALSPQEIEDSLPEPTEEVLHMKEDLQKQLIIRSHNGHEDLSDHVMNWIETNSLKFRIIFNELRYNNPNLLEDYKNDCENLLAIIDDKMSSTPDFDSKSDPFVAAA